MKPRHVRAHIGGRPTPRTVRDYEAIDRQDRVIAGPFKSYGDAKDAAGSAGAVRFVPKGKRAAEAAGRTKLDQILDRVEYAKREVTIDTEGYTPEQRDKIITAAKARGFHVSGSGRWLLIRNLNPSKANAPRVREDDAEAAGAAYAQEQLESDHFMDWVREQLIEASKMPPDQVLPLKTKSDAKKIAGNMFQQLEWDTRREHHESVEFYRGFRGALYDSRDWLAEELLTMNQEIHGGGVVEARRPGPSGPQQRTKFKIIQLDDGYFRVGHDEGRAELHFKEKAFSATGSLLGTEGTQSTHNSHGRSIRLSASSPSSRGAPAPRSRAAQKHNGRCGADADRPVSDKRVQARPKLDLLRSPHGHGDHPRRRQETPSRRS